MSSPAEWYNSLPPISKAFGTLCVVTATLLQLNILDGYFIVLYYPFVFKKFQIWRLFTTFICLGGFSMNFGIHLLMIARYGVQLEKGVFERRTADFLWMMIFGAISLLVLSAIPYLQLPLLGIPMVSMLLYVWSREYPNAQINIYGLILLRSFYLPWVMLALDVIFGSSIIPGLMGIMVGHLYYYFTVLHPLATGKNYLKTPKWVYPLRLCSKDAIVGLWQTLQSDQPALAPVPSEEQAIDSTKIQPALAPVPSEEEATDSTKIEPGERTM